MRIFTLVSFALLAVGGNDRARSEEHTSELQSQSNLVCRLLLEKKNTEVIDVTREATTCVALSVTVKTNPNVSIDVVVFRISLRVSIKPTEPLHHLRVVHPLQS